MAHDDASKLETLAKMAETRAEIRRLLEPRPRLFRGRADAGGQADGGGEADGHGPPGVFPRSHTMRLLMSGRGIGTVAAVVAGLVLARPALALRLLRMIPAGAVARILMQKAVTALRAQ
jgi:hypothetical protein